jgi:hypothetical protein
MASSREREWWVGARVARSGESLWLES